MKIKKLLSVLLAVIMLLSVFSVMAYATDTNWAAMDDASFIGANKLRIAGKLDLFGLDIQVDPAYNAVITAYKGGDGFSSDEEAQIRIATNNMEHIGSINKVIDVGNVGIEAIRERLVGTSIDTNIITYDWLYNTLIDPVLANIAKQTYTFTYNNKTATYTGTREQVDGGYAYTFTAQDETDFGEDFNALFGSTSADTIQMVTDEGTEDIRITLKAGSYVRLGNEKRTLTTDLSVSALDQTGEIELANIFNAFNGDIESTVNVGYNDGKAVLDLKAGTALTLYHTTVTLNQDVRITVDGLNIDNNLISKITRITEGGSDVTLDDYTGLTNLIPSTAGTIAINAEVAPAKETFPTYEAFVIRDGKVAFSGTLTEAFSGSNSQPGDTIQLNANYVNAESEDAIVLAGKTAIGSSIQTPLTLDLNGKTLKTSTASQLISLGAGKNLTIINSNSEPAKICNEKASGIALRAGAGTNNTTKLTIGGPDSVGVIEVVASGSNGVSIKSDHANATIEVLSGTFSGAINQAKGTISISGGKFDHDPSAYVADGYEAVALTGDDVGWWEVLPKAAAKIGDVRYPTVADAFADAQDGDVIEVLDDVTGDVSYDVTPDPLRNSTITLTGNKTLTGTSAAYSFYFGDYDAGNRASTDKLIVNGLTFNNNGGNYALLVDGVSADLTNVTVNANACSGLSFANGSQAVLQNVTVANTGNHSQKWRDNALSVQGIGEGPSALTVKSGTYTSENGSAVYIYSSGGTVNIEGGVFSGGLVAQIDRKTYNNDYNRSIINISGGVFTNCAFTISGDADYAEINITGGIFDANPTDYVAAGYEAVELTEGANAGKWQVGKVAATELEAADTTDGYDATYTTGKTVVDESNNAVLAETAVTVNVVAQNTETADAELSQIEVANVVVDALAAVEVAENATVNVVVSVVSTLETTGADKVVYEVHPEATVTVVESGESATVRISNDDLKDTFTVKLHVPNDLAAAAFSGNGYLKVTHKGETDEIFSCPVLGSYGSYYVEFTVSHFSQFELEVIPVSGVTGEASFSANLALEDSVEIYVYANNLKGANGETEANPGRFTVRYTFNGVTNTVALTSATTNKIVVAKCAAKELADEVSIQLLYDGTCVENLSFSARDYCEYWISKDPYTLTDKEQKLQKLCLDLLNYGAQAQLRFDYKTDDLANCLSGSSYGNDYYYVDTNTVGYYGYEIIGDRYYVCDQLGASLSLNDKTEINVYFKAWGSLSDYSAKVYASQSDAENDVNGVELAITDSDVYGSNTGRITVPGIVAKDLDEYVYVKVSDGYSSFILKYSPMTYVYRKLDQYDSTEQDICKTLYLYNQAAKAYFTNN